MHFVPFASTAFTGEDSRARRSSSMKSCKPYPLLELRNIRHATGQRMRYCEKMTNLLEVDVPQAYVHDEMSLRGVSTESSRTTSPKHLAESAWEGHPVFPGCARAKSVSCQPAVV